MNLVSTIIKRDGRKEPFDIKRVESAIHKAVVATKGVTVKGTKDKVRDVVQTVKDKVETRETNEVGVEEVQDIVENALMDTGLNSVAKSYILYRDERNKVREKNTRVMQKMKQISFTSAEDSDIKRENANIDGDTAMGTMLKYGSEVSKEFVENEILEPDMAKAHRDGDIHIHDEDFYLLTETCCQIDLDKLMEGGFSTGHGVLREPNGIASYAALAAIAIQANQNDQHESGILGSGTTKYQKRACGG